MRYATNLFGNKYMLILDYVGVFQQRTHGSELLTELVNHSTTSSAIPQLKLLVLIREWYIPENKPARLVSAVRNRVETFGGELIFRQPTNSLK